MSPPHLNCISVAMFIRPDCDEAAIEAAMQFVFTPAYMNNGAVSVWVGMPFVFRLRDAK